MLLHNLTITEESDAFPTGPPTLPLAVLHVHLVGGSGRALRQVAIDAPDVANHHLPRMERRFDVVGGILTRALNHHLVGVDDAVSHHLVLLAPDQPARCRDEGVVGVHVGASQTHHHEVATLRLGKSLCESLVVALIAPLLTRSLGRVGDVDTDDDTVTKSRHFPTSV